MFKGVYRLTLKSKWYKEAKGTRTKGEMCRKKGERVVKKKGKRRLKVMG